MSEPTELEALKELVQSHGWQVFKGMVLADIEGKFQDDITTALGNADSAIALDKMRQVAAVRLAGLRWLRLPQERMSMLTQTEQRGEAIAHPSRRPVGV